MQNLRSYLIELIGFLDDDRPEVKEEAVKGLTALSGTEQGREILLSTNAVQTLCELVKTTSRIFLENPKKEVNYSILKTSLSCLINLSADTEFRMLNTIIDTEGFLPCLVSGVEHFPLSLVELNLMLLCNLTRNERGSIRLLETEQLHVKGILLHQLIEQFVFSNNRREHHFGKVPSMNTDQIFARIASILMNITQASNSIL